jgi:hypothetical protein
MKICVDCGDEKDGNDFYSYELVKNRGRCKVCLRLRSTNYAINNKDKKTKSNKLYRENNKDILKEYKIKYVEANKPVVKQRQCTWYQENRDRILQERKKYRATHKDNRNAQDRDRRSNDPVYRLRTNMSKLINNRLKKVNSSKDSSITNYLPYTMKDLRNHIQSQFEPWMNWDNYGKYNSKTWDDNDLVTWMWNIDHIIPQAYLPYASMSDENFQKCWALSNLRPLSAKINVINGTALSKQRKKGK